MKETMIEIVHERAAGMGISKRDVKVCIRVQGAGCRVQERLAARQLPDVSGSACATESIATVGLPTVNYCYRGDANQTRTFC